MPAQPQPIHPAKEKAKAPVRRPDLSTFAGIALALAGILGGLILEKGSIQDVAQATAAMIVLGGTLGAVMVTTPMPVMWRGVRALAGVFRETAIPTSATIDLLVQYAIKSRKNGIVSLESEAASLADPFLRKALNLAVDGTDLQELRKMMEVDIAVGEQESDAEAKVWEAAGGYAPTIGIIGAVLGLVHVMQSLGDPARLGAGIAVAFIATIYGVGSANLIFLPIAGKLKILIAQQVNMRDMLIDGLCMIANAENPRFIENKLKGYSPEAG
jgi:chemotaxis protein MotA